MFWLLIGALVILATVEIIAWVMWIKRRRNRRADEETKAHRDEN